MSTLYRKYRPQSFTEVVGQNHIKLTLEHEITSGKMAHAYLFCGPRAVGKTTLARILAKAINCETRQADSANPCNQCASCEDITLGRALDIMEIDAASHTGVDNVRENIIASAKTSPSKSKFKVFIIDEVHMLSGSAFNALLKIIEEPPARVVFILCTTEIHKVPNTIISRCQRFDFKRISVTDITNKLSYIAQTEKIIIERSILEAIARYADGHMRDAESLLGQVVAIGGKEITREEADLVIPRSDLGEVINLIGYLLKKDAASSIRLVNKLIDEGVDLKIFTGDLVEILRKIVITKINPNLVNKLAIDLGESVELKISQLSQELTIEQLVSYMEKFLKARGDLKNDFIQQLPIEIAIIEICLLAAPRVSQTYPNSAAMNQRIKPPASVSQNNAAPAPNPAEKTAGAPINISAEQIQEKWNEVLAKVKQHNHSLSFILRVCQPRNVSGNQLCLAFKYKFHKERVSELNIKMLIEKILNQVYGAPLIIEAIIDENLEVAAGKLVNDEPPAPNESVADAGGSGNNMIDNLLKTFGGKIVG